MEGINKSTNWQEKFAFGLGDIGAQFVTTFASSFLMLYYTDCALISSAIVGTMMLINRLFDGVSDILIGWLIERTATRYGKARPWFGLSIIPLALSMILVFNMPSSLSESGRIAYMCVTYFLMSVVFFTTVNLSSNAMLPRISLDPKDQSVINAVRNIMTTIGSMVISLGANALIVSSGNANRQEVWTMFSLGMGIGAVIFMGICFFTLKEKLPAVREKDSVDALSMKDSIRVMVKSKYLILCFLVYFVWYMMNAVTNGAGVYYARDVLGDSNSYTTLAVVLTLSGIVGVMAAPSMMAVLGKRKTMLWGGAVAVAGSVICLAGARSLVVILIGLLFRGIGSGIATNIIALLAVDVIDDIHRKTGKRMEGMTAAFMSIGIKIGMGLGSAVTGWVLALGGYDGSAVVQSVSVQNAEIVIMLVIPLVCLIGMMFFVNFWDYKAEALREETI